MLGKSTPGNSTTFASLDDALHALADQLAVVPIEKHRSDCAGRVLAEDVFADRDSPAADVSAMDGYAIRLNDLQQTAELPVSGVSAAGAPPPELPLGSVVRIFTGAMVPSDAEAIVKREDTEELGETIRFLPPARSTRRGEHIRRAGENASAHSRILSAGVLIHAARQAAMVNFGCFAADVFQPVRVTIITTGNEVGRFADERPEPWQLRDSNRVSLTAMLQHLPWITVARVEHCPDEPQALAHLLQDCLPQSDAVLLTGGVSMGDHDYVPEVVQQLGARVVFHGLPLRPGKPVLGAATNDGRLLLGLPGNPVSATVGCRRIALPLLARQSGQRSWQPQLGRVELEAFGEKTLPLYWLRLVRWTGSGRVELVPSQGSGDLVSLGNSDGFIECAPGSSGRGPWPFFSWTSS